MAQSGRHVLAFQAAEQEVKALSLELQQYKDWLSEAQHEVETLERSGRQLADAQKQVQALKSELQKKLPAGHSDDGTGIGTPPPKPPGVAAGSAFTTPVKAAVAHVLASPEHQPPTPPGLAAVMDARSEHGALIDHAHHSPRAWGNGTGHGGGILSNVAARQAHQPQQQHHQQHQQQQEYQPQRYQPVERVSAESARSSRSSLIFDDGRVSTTPCLMSPRSTCTGGITTPLLDVLPLGGFDMTGSSRDLSTRSSATASISHCSSMPGVGGMPATSAHQGEAGSSPQQPRSKSASLPNKIIPRGLSPTVTPRILQ
eukprot:jgi/Chrzof1/2613/Cz11g22140.t1